MNASVATAQANNGLRSAQTEEALLKAQQATEQLGAQHQLEEALGAVMGPNNEAGAHAAAMMAISKTGGDAKSALETLHQIQTNRNQGVLSDPANLGTPAATAAAQGNTNQVPKPETISPNYTVAAGMPDPNVMTSPLGQSEIRRNNAAANRPPPGGPPMDPAAIRLAAYQFYKTNTMPALGMSSGAARAALLSQAAQWAQQEGETGQPYSDPALDAMLARGQDFKAGSRALSGFDGGTQGNQVRALNNVTGHLQLFSDTFDALENGNVQMLNKLGALWQKQMGKPAPTTLSAMGAIIGPEMLKTLVNTGAGTGPEREQFAEQAGNLANSPGQTKDAIIAMRSMLARQAQGFERQYQASTGRNDFRTKYLAPDVQAMLHGYDGGSLPNAGGAEGNGGAPSPTMLGGTAPPPNGGPPLALPPAAAASLKEGVTTHFGNGTSWTKKNGVPVQVH
jgi:hypothetical protein